MKAAVIGYPVGHSLSPVIHNHWIAKYGLKGEYTAQEIRPEQLREGLLRLVDEGYTGFNVTIPHKQAIIPLCEQVDATAAAIGAANTLYFDSAGRLCATNTDAYGFMAHLKTQVPSFDCAVGTALVLGAGGAARAAVYALQQAGLTNIMVANRTQQKAEALAAKFGCGLCGWDDRMRAGADAVLLVNTTSLGMKGQPPLEFDVAVLPAGAVVYDIVYNPLQTALLHAAAARGLATVDGLGMLLHQARPAFEKWFGILPEVDDNLQSLVYEKIKP